VPRGVANGYQTLEPNVTYTYLVNAHWSPDSKYTFVNLFDPALGIDWPISRNKAIVSDKDLAHPLLADIPQAEF
jgi:dTDP-4-dehydrorhamnose 3,5-epimerase